MQYDAYSTIELGEYATGFSALLASMPLDQAYPLDASSQIKIPSDEGKEYLFDRWRVYLYDASIRKFMEITEAAELADLCGSDFDPLAEQTSITTSRKVSLQVYPSFWKYEPVTSVGTYTTSDLQLPLTMGLKLNGKSLQEEYPVTWTLVGEANGTKTYACDVRLSIDELCSFEDDWNDWVSVGLWFKSEDVSSAEGAFTLQNVSVSRGSCVLSFTHTVSGDSDQIWKVQVSSEDIVSGASLGETQDYYVSDGEGQAIGDYLPEAPNWPREEFAGWIDASVDEGNHVKTMKALYRPVVDVVTLAVDHGVISGQHLPELQSVTLHSGEREWTVSDLSSFSNAWKEKTASEFSHEQTTAKTRTDYVALYGIQSVAVDAVTALGGDNIPRASVALAQSCSVQVVTVDGASVDIANASAKDTSADEGDVLTLTVYFAQAPYRVTSVMPSSPFVFSHGVSESEIVDALVGAKVPIVVEEVNYAYAYVQQASSIEGYDPSVLTQQSFAVSCELSSDEYDLGEYGTVNLSITVLPAPSAQVPNVLPVSGSYAGGVSVMLERPNEQTVVWYAIQAVPIVRGENGEDLSEPADPSAVQFERFEGNDAIALGSEYKGKRVYVYSYATQDGCNVSSLMTRSYDITHAVPTFETISLVLGGQIGVNFFLNLPEIEGVNYADSYMEFNVNDESFTVPFDSEKRDTTGSLYGFTCHVNSIQMAERIQVTFHYGDGKTVACRGVSVEDYVRLFDEYAQKDPNRFSEAEVNLVHAIADYGFYAQPFLSAENGWTLGKDYALATLHYTETYEVDKVKEALSGYVFTTNVDESLVSNVTCRLRLDSSTAIEVSFTAKKGSKVLVDDSGIEVVHPRSLFRIVFDNIN